MFTGIIQKLGQIKEAQKSVWTVETPFTDLVLGESVAINGVCLTVTQVLPTQFFISTETFDKTNLKNLKVGDTVNLERALSFGDRLSGHLVQGHVDQVGILKSITAIEESYDIEVQLPEALSRYCIEKGSITLDGVSLTINQVLGDTILIRLIPHTWTHTRFYTLKPGDWINVEVDLMAKYAEKLCQPYLKFQKSSNAPLNA